MTFTQVRLAGHRVLVRGKDNYGTDGETVLDGAQWDSLKERTSQTSAHKAFDSAVEEFFKPLTDAAEQLHSAQAQAEEGDWFVIEEPVDGVSAKPGIRVALTHDSQVLQMLENGTGHDRLLWVNDSLEISESKIPFSGGTQVPQQTVVD